MTTHEPEITAPVDLCTRDGATLHPAARGWSRRVLHRANLLGSFGRNKRWDYWAVLAGDTVVSAVYADIDHLGLADVWWADLASGASGGRAVVAPAGVLAAKTKITSRATHRGARNFLKFWICVYMYFFLPEMARFRLS